MTRETASSDTHETKVRAPLSPNEKEENVYEQASDKISSLFNEGRKAAIDAQDSLKEYTEELSTSIQKYPLSSLLIAGGIGFILSSFFRK